MTAPLGRTPLVSGGRGVLGKDISCGECGGRDWAYRSFGDGGVDGEGRASDVAKLLREIELRGLDG